MQRLNTIFILGLESHIENRSIAFQFFNQSSI